MAEMRQQPGPARPSFCLRTFFVRLLEHLPRSSLSVRQSHSGAEAERWIAWVISEPHVSHKREMRPGFRILAAAFGFVLAAHFLVLPQVLDWRQLEAPRGTPASDAIHEDVLRDLAQQKAWKLWGGVSLGEAIPAVDPTGRIIAFIFPVAIGMDKFPEWHEVTAQVRSGLEKIHNIAPISGEPVDQLLRHAVTPHTSTGFSSAVTAHDESAQALAEAQDDRWGIDDYGTVIVSSTRNGFPIPGYAGCLPTFYSTGVLARSKAETALGRRAELSHIYYFGPAGNWFEFRDSIGVSVFVHDGTLQVLDETAFRNTHGRIRSGHAVAPDEAAAVIGQAWDEFLEYGPSSGVASYVTYPELVEPYEWTYGCSPTSAAIALSYWDHYVAGTGKYTSYGKLIEYYVTIRDPCYGSWGNIYNVPTVVEELRWGMNTGSSTVGCPSDPVDYGGTDWDDLHIGIEAATSSLGYSFTSNRHYCDILTCWWYGWFWGQITTEIDANRPFVWSVAHSEGDGAAHSLCAFGYTSDKYVITYNTWDTAEHQWYYTQYNNQHGVTVVQVDTVEPGGGSGGQDVHLDYPTGGEIGEGSAYIWLYQFGSSITEVRAYYFYEDEYASVWSPTLHYIGYASTGSAGWYSIPWTFPTVSSRTGFRVAIVGRSSGGLVLARDGSPGVFYVDPVPVLCRDPSSLDFGTTSTNKTFEVWNCGGGTLSYSVSDNQAWISVSPTSGSSTGEHDTITVTVNRSGLSPGHYTGTVTIDPNYGSNQTVSVAMDVPQPDPALCRDPSSLDFGTTSTNKTFEVWNCGGGTLSYSISDNQAWISVSPTSGSSSGEHDTITVTVNRSGLSPGHYTGTVAIDPNYGSNQYVTVEMDVTESTFSIQGVATLEGRGDHAGIIVEAWLNGSSSSTVTSTLTDSTGDYLLENVAGIVASDWYAVVAYHDGYEWDFRFVHSEDITPGETLELPGMVLRNQKVVVFEWAYQPDGTRNLEGDLPSGSAPLHTCVHGLLECKCGFLFSSQEVTHQVADLYFYDGRADPYVFLANNGIGGVQDMGEVALGSVSQAPIDGYEIFGVPVIVGHTYCVLTRDASSYAKLHVTAAHSTETSAVFRATPDGDVRADGVIFASAFEAGSADVAEWVLVDEQVEPGDVLELDPSNPGHYRRVRGACTSLLGGVVSSKPGLLLGSLAANGKAVLALVGIVPVKVTNEGGPILPGDLLVTSSTPGHAMRWAGPEPCPCALVGKALEPMTGESGVILVLLTAH